MQRSLWRPSLIAMLASAVALPAAAQDAAAPDSQIAEEGDAIREIIVSAQKRDQNLQDVPIAITAFGAEALQERGLADVSAISALTPNVNLDGGTPFSGSSAVLSATIRGIGSDDFAFNIDPGVGIYLDGVFLARTVGANQDLLDVERIEVLKGPQGTLFGRNTIGGAILVKTREPEIGEFSGRGRLRVGEDDLVEGSAALNLPIGKTAAARVSGGFRKRDGYVLRSFDSLDLGNDNVYTFNAALKWEVSPSLDVLLRGDYTNRNENGAPFTG